MTLAKAEDLNVRHKFAAGLYVLGGVSFNPNRRPIGGPAASFGAHISVSSAATRPKPNGCRVGRVAPDAGCAARSS